MRLSILSIVVLGAVACRASTAEGGSDTSALSGARGVCTPELIAATLESPIKPPREVGGIDLTGGPEFPGALQADVEQAFCPGALIPSEDPNLTEDYYIWGVENAASALTLAFDKESRRLTFWQVGAGYQGKIAFRSRSGSRFGDHAYAIGVSGALLRDGAPWLIDWSDRNTADEVATEIHDGVIATFAPELPAEQSNCRTSSRCLLLQTPEGELAFGVRDVRFYFFLASITPGAAETKPAFFYGFPDRPQVHPPPRSGAMVGNLKL